MAKIFELSIHNYRGIKEFTYKFNDDFNCLLGRGDSGKTTIIEAISLVLSPNWNISFYDSDFFNGQTDNPIEIEVSLLDLPEKLINEEKYGLYIRGLDDNNNIQDELQDGQIKILTIKLEIKSDLEPQWYIINNRQEPIRISSNDRAKFNVFMISDYVDRHFSWCKGNPLYTILKENQSLIDEKSNVIIDALREAKKKIDEDSFSQFKDVTDLLKEISFRFGINLSGAKTTIDFKDISIKDGRVCLHDGEIPLRMKGKGTKRLLSMAIQTVLARKGGITIIDEIEQGLEPDRVRHIIRSLKKENKGQVFITTHSSEVITELEVNNLIIVSINGGVVSGQSPHQNFQNIIRACPEAVYAKKVIVCEGKTEIGICRALDTFRIKEKDGKSLSLKDCIYVLGDGDNFTERAIKLKQLGFNVSVLCDSDKDGELKITKSELIKMGIKIFDWENNNSIEEQVFQDLSWEAVKKIILYKENETSEHSIIDCIKNGLKRDLPSNWKELDNPEIRQCLGKIAKKKDWFKRIDHGEFLGSIIFEFYDQMKDKRLRGQIENLSNWIDR